MGNRTRPEFFKTRERLRYIEQAAFWRGYVNRQDIAATFELSMAQASADLQAYQEANPNALAYNLSEKRYTWVPKAKTIHQPNFDDAIALFGTGADDEPETGNVPFDRFAFPLRPAPIDIQQSVFQAARAGEVLQILYYSVDAGAAKERRIAPRAFGFDGFRWHVRAWCFERSEYRDFVLGRIEKAFPPEVLKEKLSVDLEWERKVTLHIKTNPKLKEATRQGLEMDFRMTNGELLLTVRAALSFYAKNYFTSLWHAKEKQCWFCVSEK